MSEDPRSEEVEFSSTAFEEWVEKTAKSKDISRGEVLDQMLSSYWILEELTGMMDEAEQGDSGGQLQKDTAGGDTEHGDRTARASGESVDSGGGGDHPEADGSSELIREFQDLRSAILELTERPDIDRQEGPAAGLVDDPQVSARPQQRTDDRLRRALSDLQDRVKTLSEDLSEVQDRHDRDVDDLQTDIDETLDTLDTLESSVDDLVGHSELESLAGSLEEELSRIEDATAELEGRLTRIEEGQSETAGEVADLSEGQSELEGRLDREFDSIENLFQHLLDTTDDLEHRLGAISDSHEADMESVEAAVAERDRLATVMREAHRKGVSTAVCDNCETTVDLRLLHEPHCPECDRSISGVEPGGWLPFDKATLETEPIGSTPDDLGGSTDPSDLLESPPDDDPNT
ncbi:MAG: hypothetical protein BRD23_09320 [Halobacteriales archaeon SW_9_67_25]|nr:MAG: hypothetical protein BRD23_09320 [Halobacteriales archaeon SW_9_67_25]